MVPAVMAAGSDIAEASLSEEPDVRCTRSVSRSGESEDFGRGAGDSGALGRDSNGRVPEVSDEGDCGGGAPRKRGGLEITGISAADGAVSASRSMFASPSATPPRGFPTGTCSGVDDTGAAMGVPGMFPTPRGRMTGEVLAESIRDASRTASSSTVGVDCASGADGGE